MAIIGVVTLVVLAFAHAVLAASKSATTTTTQTASVTAIFLPGFDQQSLVASVITAAPSATTYLVQCDPENMLNCEVGNGMTVTEGPSTFQVRVNSTVMTVSENCIMSADTASCTYSMGRGTSGLESATGLQSMSMNITITAGFEALASASSEAAALNAEKTAKVSAVDVGTTTATAVVPIATMTTTGTAAASGTASSSAMGSMGTTREMRVVAGVCAVAAGLLVL